jgi:hypothetical protein
LFFLDTNVPHEGQDPKHIVKMSEVVCPEQLYRYFSFLLRWLQKKTSGTIYENGGCPNLAYPLGAIEIKSTIDTSGSKDLVIVISYRKTMAKSGGQVEDYLKFSSFLVLQFMLKWKNDDRVLVGWASPPTLIGTPLFDCALSNRIGDRGENKGIGDGCRRGTDV